MNSVLQCLAHTESLLEYCLESHYEADINRDASRMKGVLITGELGPLTGWHCDWLLMYGLFNSVSGLCQEMQPLSIRYCFSIDIGVYRLLFIGPLLIGPSLIEPSFIGPSFVNGKLLVWLSACAWAIELVTFLVMLTMIGNFWTPFLMTFNTLTTSTYYNAWKRIPLVVKGLLVSLAVMLYKCPVTIAVTVTVMIISFFIRTAY